MATGALLSPGCSAPKSLLRSRLCVSSYLFFLSGRYVNAEADNFLISALVSVLGARSPNAAIEPTVLPVFSLFAILFYASSRTFKRRKVAAAWPCPSDPECRRYSTCQCSGCVLVLQELEGNWCSCGVLPEGGDPRARPTANDCHECSWHSCCWGVRNVSQGARVGVA